MIKDLAPYCFSRHCDKNVVPRGVEKEKNNSGYCPDCGDALFFMKRNTRVKFTAFKGKKKYINRLHFV